MLHDSLRQMRKCAAQVTNCCVKVKMTEHNKEPQMVCAEDCPMLEIERLIAVIDCEASLMSHVTEADSIRVWLREN